MSGPTNRREFLTAAGLAATASSVLAAVPSVAAAADAPAGPAPRTMGAKFRALLKQGEPFQAISCPDAVSARVAALLGFPSMYLGSSAMADYFGVPDWGIVSFKDQLDYFSHTAQSVDIPGIADIDDNSDAVGFYRNAKLAEAAGIGCLHFEDGESAMGKVKGMIPIPQMVDRIHAAADARTDMCLSVRCVGKNLESIDKTIERANAYVEAGADKIWCVPMTLADMPKVAAAVKAPLTTQIFVDTTIDQIEEAKVTVMIYASFLQNIMQGAMYEALLELKTTGMLTKAGKGQRLGQGMPADVRTKINQTPELTERGKKYHEA